MSIVNSIRAYFARFFRQEWGGPYVAPPDGYEPVNVFIAGIRYENRVSSVLRCSLREKVWLRREPDNEYDANAVEVVTQQGDQLGHLGRHLAARLAPYMDEIAKPIPAVITELTSDITGSEIGAKVGFYVPREVFSRIKSAREHIEFFCEVGSAGSLYLLLDCDEAALTEITSKLTKAGLEWARYGMSYRPAADGRQYQWYILLEENVTETDVVEFFASRFGIIPQTEQVKQFEEAWIESEEESEELKATIDALEDRNRDLEKENRELRQRIDHLKQDLSRLHPRGEIRTVIQTLLPDVEFLRKSMDVITFELKDNRQVLSKLQIIASGKSPLKTKAVQSAPGWCEVYYSTGQRGDGRLYFKRSQDKWLVLVSFKANQERDIKYLRTR